MEAGLEKVLAQVSQTELADKLGISVQAITDWKNRGRIPAERVLAVEEISGVPRHEMRPDLYPPPRRTRVA